MMTLPEKQKNQLDQFVARAKERLGADLSALVLYGSAVRGGYDPDSSDLNVLIVLQESLPKHHLALAELVEDCSLTVEPFIISKNLLPRALQAFAVKFQSIQRQHTVLYGESPFENLQTDPAWSKFLAEQALLNLRFRTVRAFVMWRDERKRYAHYLKETAASFFVDLSEPLRIEGVAIPEDFRARLPVFSTQYDSDTQVLSDLLDWKTEERRLSSDQILSFHSRLFMLLEQTAFWVEKKWRKV